MPMTGAQKSQTWRKRRRTETKARRKMFAEFAAAFPGEITIGVYPADDPHGDLKDPITIRVKFPDGRKLAIAAFAHERDLSVDDLFDQLAIEAELRLKKRGVIPDHQRELVE